MEGYYKINKTNPNHKWWIRVKNMNVEKIIKWIGRINSHLPT